jgi:hypothetical protein
MLFGRLVLFKEMKMDHKLKATAKEAELKAHLEGIVGRKVILPTVPIGPVNLFYLLGAFDNIAGYITSKNLLYDNVTRVSPANLIDVSGVSSTDGTGKGVFRLSTFVGGELAPAEPINIVATASGTVPVFFDCGTYHRDCRNLSGGYRSYSLRMGFQRESSSQRNLRMALPFRIHNSDGIVAWGS